MYIHHRDFLTPDPFVDSHVHLFDAEAVLKAVPRCCVGFLLWWLLCCGAWTLGMWAQ